MSEWSARVIGLRGVPSASRGLASLAASVALVGSLLTVAAPPAVALESTLLSPTTVDPGAVAAVTIDGNDYRIENSVYQFQFEGFSGLTVGGSCPNVTVTTNPAQGSAGVGNVTCTIPASNQIKLVFGSATPTATRGSVTVAIASAAGLTAPQTPGSYGIVVRDWQNDVIPGISGTICVGFCTQPQAPLITIDIDSNGGTCGTAKVIGFATTWANAPRDCSKPGFIFKGFNTNAGAADASIAPGGNLHLTGDNRIYAIYETPRTRPGVPTDVVSTPGRNSVKVTWKPPVSDGGDPINSYCVALRTEQNPNPFPRCSSAAEPLERTVNLPATNSKYTFSVFARNSQGSSELAVSAPVSPYDIKGVIASRKDLLLGLGGTQVEARGDAPGLAGQSLNVEYKVGAGQWTTQANAVSVDAKSNFRWSKKFPRSSNKNAVTVRFSYGTDAVVGPFVLTRGGEAGDLSAPRNIKVDNRPNKINVTWDRPKFDGGATITGYTLCATPGDGIGGRICRSETGTEGTFWNLNTRQTYTFTVSAKTTTREGPRGKYSKPVDPTDASIRSAARSFDELTADVRGAGFKKNSRFRVEVASPVPGVNPDKWDWDQVTSFREDQESFTRSLRIPLDASVRGERLMLRLITPTGTVYSRSIRP